MNLSYGEIVNLINKDISKHKELLKSDNPQVDKGYSRYAVFALRDFEKEVRAHLAKKYK